MSTLAKQADLAGPGIGDYTELEQVLPRDYAALLSPRETMVALFAAKGFHGTGIRELADAAGLSSATLYHYMGTKEDLLVEDHRAAPTTPSGRCCRWRRPGPWSCATVNRSRWRPKRSWSVTSSSSGPARRCRSTRQSSRASPRWTSRW